MKQKIRYRILRKYSKECRAIKLVKKGWWDHEWCPSGAETSMRDAIGRQTLWSGSPWITFKCNNCDCNAEIMDAIGEWTSCEKPLCGIGA